MASYDELVSIANQQLMLENEAKRQLAIESAAEQRQQEESAPGRFASFAAGAREGGRKALLGLGQVWAAGASGEGVRAGITQSKRRLAGLPDTDEELRSYEQNVMAPSNLAAAMRNAPYQQANPLLFSGGQLGADIAATVPLALATKNPQLGGLSLLQKGAAIGKATIPMGTVAGAMTGAMSPAESGLTPEEFAAQKGVQIGIGGVSGAIAAPAGDIIGRGVMGGIKGLGRAVISPVWNRLRPSPVKPTAEELIQIEQGLGVPGVLTLDELSGNPALQRTAVNLEQAPASGMTEFRQQQQQRLKELAERQVAGAEVGGAVPAPQVVAAELGRVTDTERLAMQRRAEAAALEQKPAGVETPGGGIQTGLRELLGQKKTEAKRLYGQVGEQLRQEGLQGSPVDTAPIEQAVGRWFQVVNPDTWNSIAETKLGRTLTAIRQGLTNTRTLEQTPYDNLMGVLDTSATRASSRFPEEAENLIRSVNLSDRDSVITAIRKLNWLEEASPASVLGPRPAMGVGIQRKIWELGGIKNTYMPDVLGESSFQRGMMPGLFRREGQSPDYIALRLQEEGYPVDDSIEGVQRMFELIKEESGGGRRTVASRDVGVEQLQSEYESALQRANQGKQVLAENPALTPGRALDWEGTERLRKDINELYGKEKKIAGRVGSTELAALTDLLGSVKTAQQNWAYSTGSPRVLELYENANKFYSENIPPYKKGGVSGVSATLEAETTDKAYGTLFSPKAPGVASKAFGMMTPIGQQASKWGIWTEAMDSAMKTGRFDRDAFEGAFRRYDPVINKTFSRGDKEAISNILGTLENMAVDRDVERSIRLAAETGDYNKILTQFAAANNPSRAQRITQRLMTPESKTAVESWVLNKAYESATKGATTAGEGADIVREGWFSPLVFSSELTKYAPVLQQIVSPGRYKELEGLMVLMSRARRAGQYNEYPPTGARLWSQAQGLTPFMVIGGLFGTYQGGGSAESAAAGAIAGAGIRVMGEKVIRNFLTTPKGRAVLRRISGLQGAEADNALQSPGISSLMGNVIKLSASTEAAKSALDYDE